MENSPDSMSTWPHHRLPEFSSLLRPESRAMAKPSPANRTPKDSLSPGENTQSKEAVCTPSMLPVGGAVTMRQLYMGESRSSTSSSLSDSLSDFCTSSPDARDRMKGRETEREALSRKEDHENDDGTERATLCQPSDECSSGSTEQVGSERQPKDDSDTSMHKGLGHPQSSTADSATDSEETESESEFAEGIEADVDGKTVGSHSQDQFNLHMTPESVESNTPESPLVKDAVGMEDSSSDVTVSGDKAYSATFSVLCANSSLQDFTQADFMDRVRARVRVGSPDWSLGLGAGDVRYCTTPSSEVLPSVEHVDNPPETHSTLHTPPLTVNRSPNVVDMATEQNKKLHEASVIPSLPTTSPALATQTDSCSQNTLIGGTVAGGKIPDATTWYRRLPQPPQPVEPVIPDSNRTTIPDSMSYPCPEIDADMIQDGAALMWNQSPELTREGVPLLESSQQEARTSLNKHGSAWKFTYTHPWDFSPRKSDETLTEYQAKPSSAPVHSSVCSDLATEEHLVRMTGQVPAKTNADVTQQTWSACPMYTPLPSTMSPAVSISQPAHNDLNLLTQTAQEQAETLSSILPGQQFLVYLVPGPPDTSGTPGPPTLLYVPHTPGIAPPVIRKDIMQHGQIHGNKGNNNNNKSGYVFIPVRPDPVSSAQFQTGYIGQPVPPYANPPQSGHSFPQVQRTFPDPTPQQLYNTGEPPVSTPVLQGGTTGQWSHSCPVYNTIPTSSTYSSHMTTAPMRGNSVGLLKKTRGQPASSSATQYDTQAKNVAAANNTNPVSIRYNMIGCFTDAGVVTQNILTQSSSGLLMSHCSSVMSAPGNSLPSPVELTAIPDERERTQQVNWRQMYPGYLQQQTHTKSTSLLRQHLQSKQAALGKPQASASISSFSGLESLDYSLSVNNSSTVTGSRVSAVPVEDSSMLSQSGITLVMETGTGAVSQVNLAVQAVERAPTCTTTLDTVKIAEPTGVRSEVPESTTGQISTTSQPKVDPRMHPPRHYEFKVIQVGTWKIEHKDSDVGQTAKIKLLFASRKLVYEFQLNSALKAHDMGMRQLASVEIPFNTIVAINAKVDKITLEVCEVPMMYFGTRVCPREGGAVCGRAARYRRDQPADITGGQLQTVPYHKIKLRSATAVKKVQDCLERFDPRFVTMMRTPLTVDPNKRLIMTVKKTRPVPVVTQPPSCPLRPRGEADEGERVEPPPKRPHVSDSCSCSSGCSSRRCGCWSCMRPCEPSCQCTNCNNPLMVLRQFGVDVDKALEDDCLVLNFAKVPNLRQHLQTLYHLPCCGAMVQLLAMIPGCRSCPKCKNKAVYSYSWCNFLLCDQNKRPRNHCTKCRKCKDFRDVHCQKCNTCYFAGALGEQRCPCSLRQRTSQQTASTESLSSFFQFFAGTHQQPSGQGTGLGLNQLVPSSSNQHGPISGSEV
ncbi:uncharacterized protein LOC118408430 [Branchiostoma floridae]|uniref:Uncharacterized protein LOC118408430 n=1 Tax=Branchiostoma floridae TaxID=7739 RepID=A0A9J7KIL2_BRAFL|nr:uncharacterized protein LOC118408430 [Branchiostoma floridae]